MFKYVFRAVSLVAALLFLLLMALGGLVMLFAAHMPLRSIMLYFILPGCLLFGIVFVLCGVAAHVATQHVAEPLNRISPDRPPEEAVFPEVEPLIHSMREKQAAFYRKQEEFEQATRHMTEGLILLNGEGKVISVNDAARRIFRLDNPSEGRDILFLYPSDTMLKLICDARAGRRSESSLQVKHTSYQVNASPVFQAGKVVGIVLLIFDVTQRERAEKMRREFTANVSHELKTPLQTISGCAELLTGGMVKEADVPRFSRQIYTEAQRMIALVDDIIKLSRLDEGTAEMNREQVDLYALAARVVERLQPAAREAGVTVEVTGENCRMEGFPQMLEGIVYNLCDNAIKYNKEKGSVQVDVRPENEGVRLEVSDTGIGIPIHQQERVFERFYRVDKSHSKAVGGTGLGLSIVKHAAKLHQAEIALESEPGKGTKVTVVFPGKNG